MKRKNNITKVKTRKVPKSNDSGVSTEIVMHKGENKQKVLINEVKASLKPDSVKKNIEQELLGRNDKCATVTMGSKWSTGYQSDKSCISFENDTQSCLDYEPSEDEVENYIDSSEETEFPKDYENYQIPNTSNNQSLINDDVRSIDYSGYERAEKVQNSEVVASNKFEDLINESQINSCCSKSYDNGCKEGEALDVNIERLTDGEQNDNNWNDEEGKVDEDISFVGKSMCNQQENSEINVENYSGNQDKEISIDLFRNAEIICSGPLNITITRSVNNEIKSFNTKSTSVNDENCPFNSNDKSDLNVVKSPSTICSINANNSRRSSCCEISSQNIQWPKQKLDLNLLLITSNDHIFKYNLGRSEDMCNQSEVSSIFDLDSLSEHGKNICKIRKVSDYSFQVDANYDRINDSYKNPLSENQVNIQSVITIPPELKSTCEISTNTSMNPQNVSHNRNQIDEEPIKMNSDKNSLSAISRPITIGSTSSQDDTLDHSVKRPYARSCTDAPSKLYKEDALSIQGTSIHSNSSDNFDGEAIMKDNGREEFVNRWLLFTGGSDIHQILESLCEAHFTSKCDDLRCEKSHSIDVERIKEFSFLQLNELYEHAKKNIFWFRTTFDMFADCFKSSSENGRICLVDMINDVFIVFNGTFIDKTSYISKIVAALQSTGLSFKEAMEYIILRYGTSHISICDILLFIISKQSHLEDHWCLVQKIICCRREKLDPHMVVNILNSILSKCPPDLNLCTKVYFEIFEKELVDLDKIPDSLLKLLSRALNCSMVLETKSIQRVGDGTFSSSYSRCNQNLRESPARFKCDNRNRYRIEYTTGVEERFQNNSLNSECPRLCNSRRIQNNGIRVHNSNPLFIRSGMSSRGIPQKQNRNISNIDNRKVNVPSNEENYCCDKIRNMECKDLDTTIKQRIHTVNSRKIKLLDNPDYLEVKNYRKRTYSDGVLNKINENSSIISRAYAASGNSIAHPSAQPSISRSYECNVSIHNLYPDIHKKSTEITKHELLQLRDALDKMNGEKFLKLIDHCHNTFTIENFILNSLILIKSSTNSIDICKKFLSILRDLEEVDVNYLKKPCVKMVIEVLAMNLIYFLERKGEWVLCEDILLKIEMKNWHTLITSKIFFCNSHLMSHMCRYIYITEILTRAGDFHWANEIFQLKTLCLLGPVAEWPYQKVPSDLRLRNDVLKLFFKEGFVVNIVAVNDVLNHIHTVYNGRIEGCDIWKLFDKKLSDMLDFEEEYKSILRYLFPYITNYGRYMANKVLKRYMLFSKDFIKYQECFKLFEMCCSKGVYHKYTGNERVILLKTTMCDFEISSILKFFFENILKRHIRPHDFCIELKLSDLDQPDKPNVQKKTPNRSIFDAHSSIVNILKLEYGIVVNDAVETSIIITESMQQSLPLT